MVELDFGQLIIEDEAQEMTDEQIQEILREGRQRLIQNPITLENEEEFTKPQPIDLENPKRYYAVSIKGFKPEKLKELILLHERVLQHLDNEKMFLQIMWEILNTDAEIAHKYKDKVIKRSIGKCDRLIMSNKLFDCYDTLTGYMLIVSRFE
jgi:hypothetical protein